MTATLTETGCIASSSALPASDASWCTVLYVSHPAGGVTDARLRRLVGAAQLRNRRRDITGWLCFTGRHYVQVLEGRSDEVGPLLRRIAADPNHQGMRVLAALPCGRRRYDAWAMALLPHLDLADEVDATLALPHLPATQAIHLADRLWQAAAEADSAWGLERQS